MAIWSEPAKADLQSIHQFIAHGSKPYAKKVIQDLVAKTDVLDELPRIGRVVPDLGSEEIRELSLFSYRLVYEIKTPDIARRNWLMPAGMNTPYSRSGPRD